MSLRLLLILLLWLSGPAVAQAVAFSATAAVTFGFTAASDSTARTIPTADAVYLACVMTNGTSDTIAATIAGAGPTESFQAVGANDRAYFAVFVGAPSGSQTVAISGGDAGDVWSCGFRGVDDIDPSDPFDGTASDSASPLSIDVVTTADGLAVGVISGFNEFTPTDTEVMEGPFQGSTRQMNTASAPGTGGTVAVDWTVDDTAMLSIAANLRNAAVPVAGCYLLQNGTDKLLLQTGSPNGLILQGGGSCGLGSAAVPTRMLMGAGL